MPNKKAQSTMEYLVILSAITAAIILFATTTLKPKVQAIYTNATNSSMSVVEGINFTTTGGSSGGGSSGGSGS